MSAITSAARAAVRILEAAESTGLPLPFMVTASEYRVTTQFHTLEELAAWADYLEAPTRMEPHEGNTVATVSASMFEQPLELSAYIRADRPVVLTPEAIGDPDQTPIVQLPPAMVAHFERTRCVDCQQINHTHAADCPKAVAK